MLVAISLNTGQRITLQIFPTSCDMIVQLYALFRMISFRLFYAKCNERYLSPSQQRETPFRTPQVQSCPPLCDWTVFDVMRMREYMQASICCYTIYILRCISLLTGNKAAAVS